MTTLSRRSFLVGLAAAPLAAAIPAALLAPPTRWVDGGNVRFWQGKRQPIAGDSFTIEGVYAVDPVTKAAIPRLQTFTVREAVALAPRAPWVGPLRGL